MAGENTIFSLIPRKKRMKLAPSYLRKGDDDNYYDASVSNGDNQQVNNFAGLDWQEGGGAYEQPNKTNSVSTPSAQASADKVGGGAKPVSLSSPVNDVTEEPSVINPSTQTDETSDTAYTSVAPTEKVTPSMAQETPTNDVEYKNAFDYSLATAPNPVNGKKYLDGVEVSYMGSNVGADGKAYDIYTNNTNGQTYMVAQKIGTDGKPIPDSGVDAYSDKRGAAVEQIGSLVGGSQYVVVSRDGTDLLGTFVRDDGDKLVFKDAEGNEFTAPKDRAAGHIYNAATKPSNVQFLQSQGLDTSAQMQKDYEEYMKNAPEYISEEEQARRLRSSQSAKTVADLGSLASAFANLWGTNKGAYNQQVAYAKAPDYNSYITQWTKQRDAYKTYAQKGRDYVYQRAIKDAQQKYNNDLQKLNLEYKQAQIDFEKAKSNSQLVNDKYKQQQIELAQEKAANDYAMKLANLNEKYRMDNAKLANDAAKLGMEERRTSATEYNAYNKNSNSGNAYGVKKGHELYVGGNFNYSLPKGTDKARMEKDIVQAMIDKGELDPKNYAKRADGKPMVDENGNKIPDASKPRKTEAELIAEAKRSDKWSITAGNIVRRYGGEKIQDVGNTTRPTVYQAKDGTVFSTKQQALDHDKQRSSSNKAAKAVSKGATTTKATPSKATDVQSAAATKSKVKVGDVVMGVRVAKVANGRSYDDKGREIISY